MPALDEYFHYRSIDVSSVKELCKRWYRDAYGARPQKATAHRALDDIRESVAELSYYREHLFRTLEEVQAPAPAPRRQPSRRRRGCGVIESQRSDRGLLLVSGGRPSSGTTISLRCAPRRARRAAPRPGRGRLARRGSPARAAPRCVRSPAR